MESIAEEAAATNNMKELYKSTKSLSRKCCATDIPLKSKSGELLTSAEDQIKRWNEYYQDLMGHNQNNEITDATTTNNIIDTDTSEPTREELKEAIKNMRNNKSPGVDEIPSELWKADIEKTIDLILPSIKDIWIQEVLPTEWNNGIIIKIPKKGDREDCCNWRGVTLLCSINKILASVIHQRIYSKVEEQLRNEQAGFRKGKSCIDQIATATIIIEQTLEMNSKLMMVFIDFEKAFDSVNHHQLWNILEHFGLPQKIINLIKAMYNQATCQIFHKGYLSNKILLGKGLKQGCVLSPILFNISLDYILKRTIKPENGIIWSYFSGKKLADLEYADDICVLSTNIKDMSNMISMLEEEVNKIGLKINTEKTKEMRIGIVQSPEKIYINSKEIQQLEEFCYLGSILSKYGKSESDMDNRILKAGQAYGAHMAIIKN
nr:unnamed protein product [Callosobruchus analis]